MKLSIEKLIPAAFLLAIALFVILGIFSYRSVTAISDAINWEVHTQEVLVKLDETLLDLVNTETGVRGFIITKDESFLTPAANIEQKTAINIAAIRELIKDNPQQNDKLSQLEALSRQKISLLNEQISLRRGGSLESAADSVVNGRGKETMDKIRVVINDMKQQETSLLRERENLLNTTFARTSTFIFAGVVAGVLILAFGNLIIYSQTRKRRAAEDELIEANSRLEERVAKRTKNLEETNQALRETERANETLLAAEKAARREAETANRMRDEFLATVSHELRNPLNAILGWARVLQQSRISDGDKQKAVEIIVRNADTQNHLIADMLDVSRIITGKLHLEIKTIEPVGFVEAAIQTVTPAAEAKNIKIEAVFRDHLNKISGDANRLQQVVWNLLSNAIKFTPKDGKIGVEVSGVDSMIEIAVTDTGSGITPDFLPHVFDRFRQADGSTVKKFGGLGLGLAIVRHITEMHGGTVEAFSEGENRGATFVVKLPVSPLIVQEQRDSFNGDFIKSAAFSAKPPINLRGLSILTVDDEPDTCQLLYRVLSFYGANVKTAGSAAEALEKFQENAPDIIISDIGMPDEDGYSLIRKIRALPDEKSRALPAVALTAFARPADRAKSLAAGFQTHVSKPVEPDELAAIIAGLTGRLDLASH